LLRHGIPTDREGCSGGCHLECCKPREPIQNKPMWLDEYTCTLAASELTADTPIWKKWIDDTLRARLRVGNKFLSAMEASIAYHCEKHGEDLPQDEGQTAPFRGMAPDQLPPAARTLHTASTYENLTYDGLAAIDQWSSPAAKKARGKQRRKEKKRAKEAEDAGTGGSTGVRGRKKTARSRVRTHTPPRPSPEWNSRPNSLKNRFAAMMAHKRDKGTQRSRPQSTTQPGAPPIPAVAPKTPTRRRPAAPKTPPTASGRKRTRTTQRPGTTLGAKRPRDKAARSR